MWYKLKRIMMRPNGVEKQVRPKWWWQPWPNTKVYYNINDNDTNSTIYDLSWNWVDQTWYWTPWYTTDATYGRVATFDGNSYTQAWSIVDFGSECTFIALYKKNTANQNMAVVTECASSSQYAIWIANEFDNNKSQVWFSWSWGWWQVQSSTLATTDWVMVAWTIDSTFTTRIYINWVLDNTSTDWTSAPWYSWWEKLQIWRWRNGAPRYLNWQFKLFIWEDRCWTDQEIADLASEYGF